MVSFPCVVFVFSCMRFLSRSLAHSHSHSFLSLPLSLSFVRSFLSDTLARSLAPSFLSLLLSFFRSFFSLSNTLVRSLALSSLFPSFFILCVSLTHTFTHYSHTLFLSFFYVISLSLSFSFFLLFLFLILLHSHTLSDTLLHFPLSRTSATAHHHRYSHPTYPQVRLDAALSEETLAKLPTKSKRGKKDAKEEDEAAGEAASGGEHVEIILRWKKYVFDPSRQLAQK